MKASILLCVFAFFAIAFAQEVIIGGEFLITINDDGDTHHSAGIVTYNPEKDKFSADYDGGVFINHGTIEVLSFTYYGLFGAGYFTHIGEDYDYCNSVVFVDSDDDEYEYKPINSGIWTEHSYKSPSISSVNYIASIADYVIFAGVFSQIEELTLQSDEPVVVPNIVGLNKDQQWELLTDDAKVFPANAQIVGLAANGYQSDTVFVATEDKGLFSWSSDNQFSVVTTATAGIVSDSLIVLANGNPAFLTAASSETSPFGSVNLTYTLNVVSAGTNNRYDLYTTSGEPCKPKIIAWNGGALIAIPDSDDCKNNTFAFYNGTSGANPVYNSAFTGVPSLNAEIIEWVVGSGSDLWVNVVPESYNATDSIYYYQSGAFWQKVSIYTSPPIRKFVVHAMAWDSKENNLVVYLNDASSGSARNYKLISISSPTQATVQTPGILASPGFVRSLAVTKSSDNDDYILFAGGLFEAVGNGITANNLAKFQDGKWTAHTTAPIEVMAAYNSTLYIGYHQCSSNGVALNIGTINVEGGDAVGFMNVPVIIGGLGCIHALYADEKEVIIAGDFSVQLVSGEVVHAVLVYAKNTQTWYGINTTNTISSDGPGYEIYGLSVSTNAADGHVYLALSGHFDLTVNQGGSTIEYHDFAIYDRTATAWVAVNSNFMGAPTTISQVIANSSTVYMGGVIQFEESSLPAMGAAKYTMGSNFVPVGNLPVTGASGNQVNNILLYTDSKFNSFLYAGGRVQNATSNYTYPLVSNALGTSNAPWVQSGGNSVLPGYYAGYVEALVYETGGVGQNNTNGNDPSYSNSSSGSSAHNGWWISLLVIFLVGVVVLVIVGAGGFVYWKKKRANYEEL